MSNFTRELDEHQAGQSVQKQEQSQTEPGIMVVIDLVD